MEVFGQQRGVGVGKPIQLLYGISSLEGMGASAYRHFFGRWLIAIDDKSIDAEGEVLPVHIRQMKRSGQLRAMDESFGKDDYHRVLQFSVALQDVDIKPMLNEGKVPAMFVSAVVEHAMKDDGFIYYSAERALLQPGSSIRSPVAFVMGNRQAALKKYGQIVEAWEDEPEFIVGRFVRRNEDPWKFEPGELRGSTIWSIVHGHFTEEEERRLEELEKLMNAPADTMDDSTFASLFQKKLVRGS